MDLIGKPYTEEEFKKELAFMGYDCDDVEDFRDFDSSLSFEENLEEFEAFLEELEFSNAQCVEFEN